MALLQADHKKPISTISDTTTSVFNKGSFAFKSINVEKSSSSSSPPKPLLIVTPTTKGTYAVVLFLHGFCLHNNFYTELLNHMASHGYILVAPQTHFVPQVNCCLTPPCGPEGLNHDEFYRECRTPRAHFVAAEYGHMDMLDDSPPGIVGGLSGCMCKNGAGPRDIMRRASGGVAVAFFRAYLNGDDSDLEAVDRA